MFYHYAHSRYDALFHKIKQTIDLIVQMMASVSGQGLIGHQCGVERLLEAWQPARF